MTLDGPTRRRILRGDIITLPPTDASLRLCDAVAERAAPALRPGPGFFERLTALRAELAGSTLVRARLTDTLRGLGLDETSGLYDAPRLRAVESGGHRNPAAAPVYAAHRDTWYANPAAQINLWIPLADVDAESTLAIYPAYLARPVKNGSARFDLAALAAAGGFGAGSAARDHHPAALEAIDRSSEVRLVCGRASIVAFAGAHLHQALPQDTGTTRLSLDVRVVDARDLAAAPPNVDSDARGSTLPGFLRLGDRVPFGAAYPRR